MLETLQPTMKLNRRDSVVVALTLFQNKHN